MDLLATFQRPVLILCGHFGSGKTEIAVNLAMAMSGERQVNLVDLDLVKPYFRSRLARDAVNAKGVHLVVPEGEQFYGDLPILLPEIAGLLAREDETTILDVGGNDAGARVLGALRGAVKPELTELLFVVNARRPGTSSAATAQRVLRQIEATARLRVTSLVSNTHLMSETTPAIVEEGLALCRELARLTDCPLRCLCAETAVAAQLDDVGVPVFPLTRHIVPLFARRPVATPLAV